MKKAVHIAIFSFLAMGLGSCKKEKKPTQTTSGITGSEWFFPVQNGKSVWDRYSTVNGGRYFRTEMLATDITQDVMTNCVILVYGKLTGYDGNIWATDHVGLLPTVIFRNGTIESSDEWSVTVSPGRISVRIQNSKSFYPIGEPDPNHSFRYIVIPKNSAAVTGQKPNTQNPLSRYSESELRSISYDEICSTAGLKK
jgi:hypothetical protein